MIIQNKRLIGIVLAVALLLLVPFVAMQFTNEVNWSPFDFIVMGGLLLGTGLIAEFVMRRVKKIGHRIIICTCLLAVLFIISAEFAVGILGTPFGGS